MSVCFLYCVNTIVDVLENIHGESSMDYISIVVVMDDGYHNIITRLAYWKCMKYYVKLQH